MNPEEIIAKRFYEGYYSYLVITIVLLIAITLLILFYRKFTTSLNMKINLAKGLWVFILCLFILFESYSFILFVKFSKDLPQVRNNDFSYFTGEVIGYEKERYDNDGGSYFLMPIFQDPNTGEQLTINVFDTQLGHTYSVIYLQNSNIGVISSTIQLE